MSPTPHIFQNETLLLDPAGVLVWPRLALLAVADLHFEKGTAAAARGQLLPPWDTACTLARLADAIARHRPTTVVAVGDSFHDNQAAARLSAQNHAALASLTYAARFIWVRGNHDPAPPEGIDGESAPIFTAGPLTFRHQARPGASGEISGHFHPKARIATRAADIARPCFMADAHRIMLPSFGAYTGGLDVRAPAIAGLFPDGGQAFVLGTARIFCFAVPAPAAAPDAPAAPAAAIGLHPCQPPANPAAARKLVSRAPRPRFSA